MPELQLTPELNRIFRITHIRNVPWILAYGLHCRNSPTVDPNFVSIGSADLISKRNGHSVPISPGGTLADYVPFYFTPHSMMLLNITTGYGGVVKRPSAEIVIVVSSLDKLTESGCACVFTDGHAYMEGTNYFGDCAQLDKIDWPLLRRRDFKKTSDDVDKSRRYQAEALAHRHVPISAVMGFACYNAGSTAAVEAEVAKLGLKVPVRTLRDHFFP